MHITLGVPDERLGEVARALWDAYAPWDASGTGWAAVPVADNAVRAVVERLMAGRPEPVQFPGGEPGDTQGIAVIPVGVFDEMSGDVSLANDSVVIAGPDAGEDEQHLAYWRDARPAVALYADGGWVQVLVGRLIDGLPPVFAAGCDWPELEQSIANWVSDVAHGTADWPGTGRTTGGR